ncbi:uncharacterized protein FPRO_07131 [Fusarium proliferatum ET1]|uniref:Uncharacterized protein n=1 Tax=Fusarium proliferatum (strain ET1) TaxID=1227346 RepID=A0A1L7VA85_FUSPR|nr:uncharacterized protein FPRO_07131 [Fusarium proliferatum ET1]CZR37678.1 uncharacterized protein FPRO_07131 [Fusarium proliferatum ET1]
MAEQVFGHCEHNAGFGKSLSHHLPLLALTLSRVFSQWLMQLSYGSIDHLSSTRHMARAFRIPTLSRYAIYHSNLLKPSVFSHSQLNDIGMSRHSDYLSLSHVELEPISPQSLVSKFWPDYHSQPPRKVISVLSPILYESLAASELPSPTPKALSYEEAANKCRSDVWAIIKECERTSIKFSDPGFDIEQDFARYDHYCLFGIKRACDDNGEKQCAKPGSVYGIPWIFKILNLLLMTSSRILNREPAGTICVAYDEDCGVYGFVFYRDGGWISTVVDDKLYLTKEDFNQDIYDSTGKTARVYKKQKQTGSEALFSSKCEGANETWVLRLEKAVNSPSDIILDLTLGQDLKLTESETDSDSEVDCSTRSSKSWNAVCIIGLRVLARSAGTSITISGKPMTNRKEADDQKRSSTTVQLDVRLEFRTGESSTTAAALSRHARSFFPSRIRHEPN